MSVIGQLTISLEPDFSVFSADPEHNLFKNSIKGLLLPHDNYYVFYQSLYYSR